jgi:hypothetical protein
MPALGVGIWFPVIGHSPNTLRNLPHNKFFSSLLILRENLFKVGMKTMQVLYPGKPGMRRKE